MLILCSICAIDIKDMFISQLSTCNSLRMNGRLEAALPVGAKLFWLIGEYELCTKYISHVKWASRRGIHPFNKGEYLSHVSISSPRFEVLYSVLL